QLEALLHAIPIFKPLERVELARLVGSLEEAQLVPRELIFKEDDESDGLYIVESGQVHLTIRTPAGERKVFEAGPRLYFRQGAPAPRAASVPPPPPPRGKAGEPPAGGMRGAGAGAACLRAAQGGLAAPPLGGGGSRGRGPLAPRARLCLEGSPVAPRSAGPRR